MILILKQGTPKLQRIDSKLATKLNQALNDDGSESRKLRKLRRKIVEAFSGPNKIRNIILVALIGAGVTAVICSESNRMRIISVFSKVVSKCESMLPSEKTLDVNTAVETSSESNPVLKVIGISLIVIITSLMFFKKLSKGEAPIEIIESSPISWWEKTYPMRVIVGTVMTVTGTFFLAMPVPALNVAGCVLYGTGWQLATQGVPSS